MYNPTYFFLHLLPLSLYACSGLITGILLFTLFSFSSCILMLCGALFLLLLQYFKILPTRHTIIIMGAFLFGFGRIALQVRPYNNFPYHQYDTPHSITGIITHSLSTSNKRFGKCLTLYVANLNMSVQVYTKPWAKGTVGDTVTIDTIQLKKPNSLSYQNYLLKEGILCSLFLEHPTIHIDNHPRYSISRSIHLFREKILKGIKSNCSYKTFCIFSALFLGDKSQDKEYLDKVADQFKEWGIVHYLARSGLHLVIFIILWELLCGFIPIRFGYKQSLLLIITMIYFILSWPSVSFMRALIIFIIHKWCALSRRPTHFLNTLLTTCCIILIINPMQLFFLDFQLTFTLTGALAWLALAPSPHK